MDEKVIDVVTKWREVYNKIEEFEPLLAPLLESEKKLRAEVIALAFPDAREGTNNVEVWPGWTLKAGIGINRKVDEAALPAVKEQLTKMNVNPDTLIRNKPEVALKAYRQLTEEQRKVFDTCLDIKPATPTLELVPPKEG